MNKSKIYMIVCICILCVSILGSSIAYYREELFKKNVTTITHGLDYYINYAKGQDIQGVEIQATTEYTYGNSTDIELWKKDNTYDIYGHIYLDINEIGTNLANSSALKYTLVNNGHVMSEGVIKGNAGDSVLVLANIPLQTTKQLYTIYVWLDVNENPDSSIESETISLTARCEATMKPLEVPVNLLHHINNLYIANYDPTANVAFEDGSGMNYYAPNVSLMNDGMDRNGNMTNDPYTGNIRYYGDNPNNYIYFNCSDYSDASTCEIWRIIGIVDGKVKLIKNESLGNYSWDYTSDGSYDNNWSDATLNTLLNNTYYYSDTTTYYNGSTTGTSVSFSTNGITTATRNNSLISSSTWYTNGMTDSDIYTNESYIGERTGNSTWIGNIGLAYPSDYGYSVDLHVCQNTIYRYGYNSDCLSLNWLTTIFNADEISWLLTPTKNSDDYAWEIDVGQVNGRQGGSGIEKSNAVRTVPVLYLDPELIINKGDGSSGNPYRIYVEPSNLIEYISSSYVNGNPIKITQTTSNDTYYYTNETVGLMNDGLDTSGNFITDNDSLAAGTAGNIRFYGANSKNYIDIGDVDSSGNVIPWRIIGIMKDIKVTGETEKQDLIKVVRDVPPYQDSWSYDASSLNTSTLGDINAADFYNGLSTEVKDKIVSARWNLGGWNTASGLYPNDIYKYERSSNKNANWKFNTFWDGNVALMYPSDYGYASNLAKCNLDINSYNNNTDCTETNWLFNAFEQWLLTPDTSNIMRLFYVSSSGEIGIKNSINNRAYVRPVLYLKSNFMIMSGDGTSGKPYKIV